MTITTPFSPVKSISMLERLVAFDTVSRKSNMTLIGYVQELLRARGIESRLVHNEGKTKANLIATLGPSVEGGIVLSGHTDVVPVDDQAWVTDPFVMIEREGKLYGRGTSDMKGFIAIILGALDDILAAGLKKPLHLAFSYDEEVGCLGVPSLIKVLEKEVPKPDAVIVGEPTLMKVVSAHKGIMGVRTAVRGHEAHSSLTHLGVSAVMVAAELIQFLQQLANEAREKGPINKDFMPPHTTITVNKIDGGTALNILAGHCTFHWDVRALPEDDPQKYFDRFRSFCNETVLPRLRSVAPECNIESTPRSNTPSMPMARNSAAEQLCRQLTGDNETRAVSFAAEAGLFSRSGLPVVICGPGSIDQAHQPNEFIAVSQMEAGTRFLHDLVKHLSR